MQDEYNIFVYQLGIKLLTYYHVGFIIANKKRDDSYGITIVSLFYFIGGPRLQFYLLICQIRKNAYSTEEGCYQIHH